jgi:hypothetical protein
VSQLSRATSANMKQDEKGEHLTNSKDVMENRLSSHLEKDVIFSDIEDSSSFINANNFESDSIDTISLSPFCSCSNSISESIHAKDFDDIPTMNADSIRNQYTSFALTQGKKDVRLDTNGAEHIDLKSFDWYLDTQFMRRPQSRVSYNENSCSLVRSKQQNDAHQPSAAAVSELSNKLSRRGISSNDSICMKPLDWCSYDGLSTTKPVQQQELKHFQSLDKKSMYGSCISMPPLDATTTGSINTEITRQS